MLTEALLAIIVLVICLWFKWQYSFWARRKVDGPAPYPIVGNLLDYVLVQKHYAEVFEDIYRSYPTFKFVGIYKMGVPAVLIRDLNLIEDVLVREFSSFDKNDFNVNPKRDPLIAKNPFIVCGEEWKKSRMIFAPLFTPAKLKSVFPLIKEVCNQMREYIENGNDKDIEAKDLCAKFSTEVVASCAFGFDGESFTNPDAEFRQMGDQVFGTSFLNWFRLAVALYFPSIGNLIPLPFVSQKVDAWFRRMVKDVVQYREERNEKRIDFLQSLIQLQKNEGAHVIDENTMVGHSLTFLTDGFETTSTLMTYALYELAINKDVQRRVQQEIDSTLKKHGGELNDECIAELKYLDTVLDETLRLHTPFMSMIKICTKSFELPLQYEDAKTRVTIEPNTPIIIPITAVHSDPKNFPNPNRFDPDRFSKENKQNMNRYSYLAFGDGPRICVGMKFGLLMAKTGLTSILATYSVEMTPESIVPPPISKKSFLLACEEGIWINLIKRDS